MQFSDLFFLQCVLIKGYIASTEFIYDFRNGRKDPLQLFLDCFFSCLRHCNLKDMVGPYNMRGCKYRRLHISSADFPLDNCNDSLPPQNERFRFLNYIQPSCSCLFHCTQNLVALDDDTVLPFLRRVDCRACYCLSNYN